MSAPASMDFASLPADQVINRVAQLERRLYLVEQMLVSTAQHADRTATALSELGAVVQKKTEERAPPPPQQQPQQPQHQLASAGDTAPLQGPQSSPAASRNATSFQPPGPAGPNGGFRLRTLA